MPLVLHDLNGCSGGSAGHVARRHAVSNQPPALTKQCLTFTLGVGILPKLPQSVWWARFPEILKWLQKFPSFSHSDTGWANTLNAGNAKCISSSTLAEAVAHHTAGCPAGGNQPSSQGLAPRFSRPNISVILNYTFLCFKTDPERQDLESFQFPAIVYEDLQDRYNLSHWSYKSWVSAKSSARSLYASLWLHCLNACKALRAAFGFVLLCFIWSLLLWNCTICPQGGAAK